jgi:hypothetical protein
LADFQESWFQSLAISLDDDSFSWSVRALLCRFRKMARKAKVAHYRAEGGKSRMIWIILTLLTLAALGALDRRLTQPTAVNGLIFVALLASSSLTL